MKEKERYEIQIYDYICVDLYDNGVLDKSINDTYKLEELLNQQSKRLKELEQENQQLREDLQAKDILVNTYMSVVGTLDNAKQLKQSQKELAIIELKKLKENVWQSATDLYGLFDYTELAKIIDNQIKELKKEMK